MMDDARKSGRRGLLAALAVALAMCVLFLAVLSERTGEGFVPRPVRAESMVDLQFARMLAGGNGPRYVTGGAFVPPDDWLYTGLLTLGWAAGLREDAAQWTAVLAGMLSVLLSVLCTHVIVRAIRPEAATGAAILAALAGTSYLAAFAQSGVMLFGALVLGVFACIASGFAWPLFALMPLLALSRVEAIVPIIIPAIVALCPGGKSLRGRFRLISAAAAGVALILVRVTAHRLLFDVPMLDAPVRPLFDLVLRSGRGVVRAMDSLLFGLGGTGSLRVLLPLVGGILAFCGIMFLKPEQRSEVAGLGLCMTMTAVGLLLFAIAFGKPLHPSFGPLIWIVPIWVGLAVVGVFELRRLSRERISSTMLLVVLGFFQLFGAATYLAPSFEAMRRTTSAMRFVQSGERLLDGRDRVGTAGSAGLQYALPSKTFVDITGDLTPSLHAPECLPCYMEVLKADPSERFDVWLLEGNRTQPPWISPFVGPGILGQLPLRGEAGTLTYHQADWSPLVNARLPVSTTARNAVRKLQLVQRMDVGNRHDEATVEWKMTSNRPAIWYAPFVVSGTINGREVVEAGRLVTGAESFQLRVDPDKPLKGVLRSAMIASVPVRTGLQGTMRPTVITIRPPLELPIEIDGHPAGGIVVTTGELEPGTPLMEKAFKVSPDVLTSGTVRFRVRGDFISLGWWFYQ